MLQPFEIARKAKQLQTREDFLELINEIRIFSGYAGIQPISLRQLARYSNPNSNYTRYRKFSIPKKSGGKREICAPMPKLRAILWPLKQILDALYEPSPCVMGFTPCRNIVDNAKAHLGQNYILNLDLKDFFPSIRQGRVWKRLQLPPFNFTQPVASIIAGLCSIRINDEGQSRYVLPQGAPTSPVLTNIICEKLDRQLSALARKNNLRYTRYADDITFSSMHSVLSLNGEVFKEIVRTIEAQGFSLNEKKTRLQKRGSRQEITGLVISNKVNTPKEFIHELDLLLYVWETFGYAKAYARMLSDRMKNPVKNKRIISLESVIGGKLNYLKMVKGERDKVYLRYSTLFMELKDQKRPEANDVFYLATYAINDFLQQFETKIDVAVEDGKVSAFFALGGLRRNLQLTNRAAGILKLEEGNEYFQKLHVSLCKNKEVLFWLCHTKIPKPKVTEHLSISVKKLIDIWDNKGIEYAIAAELNARNKNKSFRELEERLLKTARLPKSDSISAPTTIDALLNVELDSSEENKVNKENNEQE